MQLLDSQQVVLSVQGKNRAGNTVEVPGTLTWTTSDESILTVTENEDGTATVVTTGALGTAAVTVSNDLEDDGTEDFMGSLAFDVVAGPMNEITVTAAEPTDR